MCRSIVFLGFLPIFSRTNRSETSAPGQSPCQWPFRMGGHWSVHGVGQVVLEGRSPRSPIGFRRFSGVFTTWPSHGSPLERSCCGSTEGSVRNVPAWLRTQRFQTLGVLKQARRNRNVKQPNRSRPAKPIRCLIRECLLGQPAIPRSRPPRS